MTKKMNDAGQQLFGDMSTEVLIELAIAGIEAGIAEGIEELMMADPKQFIHQLVDPDAKVPDSWKSFTMVKEMLGIVRDRLTSDLSEDELREAVEVTLDRVASTIEDLRGDDD